MKVQLASSNADLGETVSEKPSEFRYEQAAALPKPVIARQKERAESGSLCIAPLNLNGQVVRARLRCEGCEGGSTTAQLILNPGPRDTVYDRTRAGGLWIVRGDSGQRSALGVELGRTNLWHRVQAWAKRHYGRPQIEKIGGLRWIYSAGLSRQPTLTVDKDSPMM